MTLFNRKTELTISDEDRQRITKNMMSVDVSQETSPIEGGGEINLPLAVLEGAERVIKRIDDELDEIERRREKLISERLVHHDMLIVARRFYDKIKNSSNTGTIT